MIRRYMAEGDGGGAPPSPAPEAPATAAAPTPGQPSRPKWMDQLPKGRQVPETWYTHDTLDKLVGHAEALEKKAAEAEARLGRSVVFPTKDSSPEEVRAFLAKLDIPEAPDGYALDPATLKAKDGDQLAKMFSAVAHKAGMTKAQAQQMFGFLAGLGEMGSKAQEEAAKTRGEAFKAELLKASDGDEAKAKATLRLFESFAAKRIADPETLKALQATGMLQNARFVQAIAKVEELFADPAFIEGRGNNKPAPAGLFGSDYSDTWRQQYGKR